MSDVTPRHLAPELLPGVAQEVTLRLEHWYLRHRIALPPETKAEFTRMAFEALLQNPDRERDDLLEDLLLELDGMLGEIIAEPQAGTPRADEAPGRRQGWLERLRGRGRG